MSILGQHLMGFFNCFQYNSWSMIILYLVLQTSRFSFDLFIDPHFSRKLNLYLKFKKFFGIFSFYIYSF